MLMIPKGGEGDGGYEKKRVVREHESKFFHSSRKKWETHEAIPNKIKWDIDELVLKVNDLLRSGTV